MRKALPSFLLASFLTIGIHSVANGQCQIDPNNIYTFVFEGRNYEVIKENLKWEDAAACAVFRGGILAEIDSPQEQTNVFDAINEAGIVADNTISSDGGGAAYIWIGGNDATTEGKWVWDGDNDGVSEQFWEGTATGSPVNGLFNNWGMEPDNSGNQDGLGLAFTNWPFGIAGQWNDVRLSNRLYFVVEYLTPNSIFDKPNFAAPVLKISPNPATGNIIIDIPDAHFSANESRLIVFNSLGAIVREIEIKGSKVAFDAGQLAPGAYFVKLKNGNVEYSPSKLIVTE